jgi:hypothetical protein
MNGSNLRAVFANFSSQLRIQIPLNAHSRFLRTRCAPLYFKSWVVLSSGQRPHMSARVQVSKTELDWLVGMSH